MTSEDLKNIRNNAGLSQTEFAKKLGVNMRTVQNWEGGQTKIPKSKAMLIRNVFVDNEIISDKNQSRDDFLTDEDLKDISFTVVNNFDRFMKVKIFRNVVELKIAKELIRIRASGDSFKDFLDKKL